MVEHELAYNCVALDFGIDAGEIAKDMGKTTDIMNLLYMMLIIPTGKELRGSVEWWLES